jgi:hypothetical protein
LRETRLPNKTWNWTLAESYERGIFAHIVYNRGSQTFFIDEDYSSFTFRQRAQA